MADQDEPIPSLLEAYNEIVGAPRPSMMTRSSRSTDGIPPSNISSQLPILTDEEVQRRCVTVTPREDPPEWWRPTKRTKVEDDEDSDMDVDDRSWKRVQNRGDEEKAVIRSRSEKEKDSIRSRTASVGTDRRREDKSRTRRKEDSRSRLDDRKERTGETKEEKHRKKEDVEMFEVQSDVEELPRDAKSSCPIPACNVRTQKLRNHVNRMHLPRLMWDNISPPVRQEKYEALNRLRFHLLRFLAKKLTGSGSIDDLLRWCQSRSLVPKRAKLLGRHIDQMRSLTDTMGWVRPKPYNYYDLIEPNHPSVLIHWRYQVAFLQHLQDDNIAEYTEFGAEFMQNPSNFRPPGRRAVDQPIVAKSILAPTVVTTPAPEWDEAEKRGAAMEVDQAMDKVVDAVGEPDMVEEGPPAEVLEERQVLIGPNTYTLVLRAFNTLSISGCLRRLISAKPQEEPTPRRITRAYDVFDSHFHLDRTSLRLLGNLNLALDQWLEEPMERPPTVPVNVVGGILIHCDPGTFPKSVPLDDRFHVAVGLHPRKAHHYTRDEVDKFTDLIQSSRVTVIGEIGLDRSDIPRRYWDQQLELLKVIMPVIAQTGKPVVFHIRSFKQDPHSTSLYIILLKFLAGILKPDHPLILHCFSGTDDIVNTFLHTFENTYFGFTYLATHFDQSQKQALRTVPSDRILLETVSPYLTPRGIHNNSPVYLGEVAERVSTIRGESLENVCRQTGSSFHVHFITHFMFIART